MRASRVLLQVVATIAVLTGAATSPALAAAPAGPSVTGAWPTRPSGPAGTEAQVVAAAADPVWSAPVTAVPDRGEPSDVSCPTTTWCMAVDLSGQALTFDGHRWSPPRKVFPKAPGQPQAAVSCPTTSFCLAVSAYGYGVYRSGTWTVVRSSLAPFRTVGCYSAMRCALVMGDAWSAHRMAYWNGSTLTTSVNMPWAVRVDSVACVSATTCHAIGVEPKGGAIALRSSGATWVASFLVRDSWQSTFDMSCPTTTFCLATSSASHAWRWTGASWADAGQTSAGIFLSPVSVSCSSATSCQAVGSERVGRWNGRSWSILDLFPIIGASYAVDCATASTCVVVDDRGRFWRGGGSTWTPAASFDLTSVGLNDLSCPTATFCMATDVTGNAVRWNGTGWTGMTRLGTRSSYVSCLSASWCMTVDEQQGTSRVWTGSWQSRTTFDLPGPYRPVACASTTACFTIEFGQVRRWNGTSWSALVPLLPGSDERVQLACAGTKFCVAMNFDGLFSVWNGTAWSAPRRSGISMADRLTCTSNTFCMVESEYRLYSTFDGRTWAVRRTLPGGGGAFGCQSSSRCLASTYEGTVYRWSGGAWAPSANRLGFAARELVCTPTRCMAMSDDQASWTL
ncbi:hypothetical protein [Terracoccus sp. 273MFTsu3.1]|uniref:hypothetical protein n=1 Tax=Terracoccus sp. 273MFTsu3.1 TaxID=1172188 RepID=UPI0003797E63|nr:hypothetical protein [Terracoccus sp. 273MFTsu3.1]